jgi:acid stress-induced BolA-like protein IbaG/YrbA
LAGRREGRPEAGFERGDAPSLGGEGPTSGGDQAVGFAERCSRFRRFVHEVASYRSMHPEKVAELIRAGLPGAEVLVRSDDQTHFEARVVSSAFEGRRSIARHQMIYSTLGERVGREIHALSIEALTPSEAGTASRG